MKTNDYLLIAATGGYSYLFFEQNAGINFIIFNLLLAVIFIVRNPALLKQASWIWALTICLVSSAGVLITSSALSVIANCFSLLVLSALSFNYKTSAIFSFLFGLYSLSSGVVWMLIDIIRRVDKKTETVVAPAVIPSVEIQGEVNASETIENNTAGEAVENSVSDKLKTQNPTDNPDGKHKSYRIFITLVVILFCFIFFALYKNANPLFAENTKWINLDFISFAWVTFTIGGLFIVYPLFYHRTIPVIENWENGLRTKNELQEGAINKKRESEIFAGVLLFAVLNFMLVILNFGDISTLWFRAALPKGINHSDFVHNGVGIIILSIVIAIGLIMYLYHKNFNNYRYASALKIMVYLWILQNMIMLFSTAIRNGIYVHDFNLTYRRIGVYAWICLAAIGLAITLVKIFANRSNWFLIKTNFALWFTVLSFSSIVNWDVLITKYNIQNKPLADVDFYYLFSLSDANIPQLLEVTKRTEFKSINKNLKYYTANWFEEYNLSYSEKLMRKVNHYLADYKTTWQSWDLRDREVLTAIKSYK